MAIAFLTSFKRITYSFFLIDKKIENKLPRTGVVLRPEPLKARLIAGVVQCSHIGANYQICEISNFYKKKFRFSPYK